MKRFKLKNAAILAGLALTMGLAAPLAIASPNAASIQRADIKLPIQNYIGDFGGPSGVKALISTFVGYVAADPHINYYFAHTNIKALKYNLTQQVCEVVGGPCKYTGPTMTATHKGLHVTTAAFNYLAQDMIKAMDKRGIAKPAQNYLLAQLAAMEPQVVTASGPLG
ncbi:group 1 truncated hemoglobin [Acidithiobacillus sp. HP-6]|uniref:group I truncated hemoglobin n=1 Tax=unclassified Acidithiobacillus TaxID=2614800 RepID=UPI0018791E2F|nr:MULTISPECIES: group 1 truncated hemoglobin [unclassified Acidithiobacillus]MBE7564269.1 group 1 truncated hemoglobin [Acidithiobacillus sp. HP-6]MBE7570183.1 group 1 truncated hemoglobin [Acidithiobacillus sp. HP-2]